MKCADPVLCYILDNGKKLYRHFSLADESVKKNHQLVFNCGKCLFCRKKKSYELAQRCVLHASLYQQNSFLTLTYDEKKEGYHNNVQYSDIQKFKKRLRQYVWRKFQKRIEVFNVHEYGRMGKKHWHLVLFNHDFRDKTLHTTKNNIPLYTSKHLQKLWPYGYNTLGDVSVASAMYQAQYMEKDIRNGNTTTKRKSKSNHKGIGLPYFMIHYKQILTLGYVPIDGKKMPVPRSFERRAHKHYCHFYKPAAFEDTFLRKRLYTPFKKNEQNKELADLYIDYKKQKELKIKDLEREWDEVISQHLETGEDPDFVKAGQNALYDLYNKIREEKF